jgi:uncharacterized iron-regulated membrane protein
VTDTPTPPEAASASSRRWRTLWRTHFYAGVISAPILLLFAITGLVILYTQPYLDATQGHLRTVKDRGDWVSFEAQKRVAEAKTDATVTSVVVPRNATTSTEFGLDSGRSAFVDPYTKAFLGTADPDGGLVGLANRLHGTFNNESVTVKLPTLAGVLNGGPVLQEFPVGDLLLEIFACWALVLVASGLYLWWPRKSRAAGGRVDKALVVPRLAKKGRARWRDLHAIPGMVFAAGTIFVLVTGLFWSAYWGGTFGAVANKITPNTWVDAPNSPVATLGSLDRLQHKINWNTGDAPIAASDASGIDPADLPAQASLDLVVAAADDEGMKPGYSISYPENSVDEAGEATYSSFTVANSWPRKTSEAKTVYLDQFSGRTIDTMDIYGNGGVSVVSDTLVSTHMGTQLGIASRIVMTLVCLAMIWSIISAVVMYTKRRRPGTAGLPRRPVDVRLAWGLVAILVVLGIVYPLWGVTALIVVGVDRFVIRKVPKLRAAFGQR